MSVAAATSTAPAGALLAAFTKASDLLGGGPAYRRQRLDAARAFLEAHPDLDAWMSMPLDVRLVELGRRQFAWQLVAFAIVSGRCHADAEFLFAKNFGHSMARLVEGLFPGDVQRLRDAAQRLGASAPGVAVRDVLPLAVAFTGRPPSSLTVEYLKCPLRGDRHPPRRPGISASSPASKLTSAGSEPHHPVDLWLDPPPRAG